MKAESIEHDARDPAEAWQEFESSLDEIARLAKTEVSPAEFHGRLLHTCVSLLAAEGGAVWELAPDRPASIAAQIQLDRSLTGSREELQRQQRLIEAIASGGVPRLIPPAFRDGQLANATPWLLVICPIRVEGGRAQYVLELFQRADGRASVEQGYLRLAQVACEMAEQYHQSRQLHELRQREQELAELVEFQSLIHAHPDLPSTAGAIASELRRLLACDRVSVLVRRGKCLQAAAISGVEAFDRRSSVVLGLERLATAASRVGQPLLFPQDQQEMADDLLDFIHSLVDQTHARGLAVVPLFQRSPTPADENPPADALLLGALVVEQFGGELKAETVRRLHRLAAVSEPALGTAVALDRLPLRAWLERCGTGWQRLRDESAWRVGAAAVVLLLLVLALVLVPAELTVEARGQLLPVVRQHVFAPSEGIVVEVVKQDGDVVQPGDVLLRMESPTLDIQLSELVGRQRTLQENLQAAQTAQLRREREPNDSAERGELAAKALALAEELRGVEAQLAVVRRQIAALEVRSPTAGAVLNWDVARQLASRPVARGETLLTVGDLNGAWQLELDIPDRRVGHVVAAQQIRAAALPIRFHLGTDPTHVHTGTLDTLAPAAQVADRGETVVRAIGRPSDPGLRFQRPGATVVAKIACGRRSLGYVWLHELWDAVRRWLVF